MFSINALDVRTSDGHNVVVLRPFTFTRKDGTVITVPAGTTSDGASTPYIIWNTLPPFGKYWMAAVLHDYLYRDSKFEKDFCDDTLAEAMDVLGVGYLDHFAIYEGVSLCGWHAFNDDRIEQLCTKQDHSECGT